MPFGQRVPHYLMWNWNSTQFENIKWSQIEKKISRSRIKENPHNFKMSRGHKREIPYNLKISRGLQIDFFSPTILRCQKLIYRKLLTIWKYQKLTNRNVLGTRNLAEILSERESISRVMQVKSFHCLLTIIAFKCHDLIMVLILPQTQHFNFSGGWIWMGVTRHSVFHVVHHLTSTTIMIPY